MNYHIAARQLREKIKTGASISQQDVADAQKVAQTVGGIDNHVLYATIKAKRAECVSDLENMVDEAYEKAVKKLDQEAAGDAK